MTEQQQEVPPLETEIVYFRNDVEFKYLIGFLFIYFFYLNSFSIQKNSKINSILQMKLFVSMITMTNVKLKLIVVINLEEK